MGKGKVSLTAQPIQAAESSTLQPEYLRSKDVERIFSIKRGVLYGLLADGKVKGVLLRCSGEKSGVRLFAVDSIRSFITSQMQAA